MKNLFLRATAIILDELAGLLRQSVEVAMDD